MLNVFSGIAVAFLAFYIVMGLYAGRKTHTVADHYVMSRSAPAFMITGTLIASNLSSVTFTAFTGAAVSGSAFAMVFQFGASATGSLVLGLYMAKYFYRMELLTIPDFFRKRYPSQGVQLMASLIVLVSMTAYMIAVIIGTVAVGQTIFGWTESTTLLTVLGGITLFTFVGGMRSVVVTDTIMFLVFLLAALVIGPAIFYNLGGIGEAIQQAAAKMPEIFTWSGSAKGVAGIMRVVEMNVLSFLIVLGAPHLISRINIAKSEREFSKAMIYLGVTLPFLVIGLIYSFSYFPLLGVDVKPVQAYPYVARNLVPPIIGAIGLSGVIAAAISTATSLFQQAAATLSADIVKEYFMKEITDKKLLLVSRMSVIVIGLLVYLGASMPALSSAAVLYAFLFATAAFGAWLPALYLGVLWKRATKSGAFWSMCIALPAIIIVALGRKMGFLPAWLPSNIVGVTISTSIMVIVSLMTTPSEEEKRVHETIHSAQYLK
ncbi:MAG: sodium:solute symporter family protein [Synergistales bacterium]|nr:sodium:solute symporter family protein [Synergistales bacterium]